MPRYYDIKIDFWSGCTHPDYRQDEQAKILAPTVNGKGNPAPKIINTGGVSSGCRNCKARHISMKRGSMNHFIRPYKLKPSRILVNDNTDFFHPLADQFRKDAWLTIGKNPQHKWFICTKYPERIKNQLPEDWGQGYKNVFIGISAENQSTLNTRSIHLFEIFCEGRYAVLEPLLEPVTIAPYMEIKLPDNQFVKPFKWIIVGGDIGNRTCKMEWIQSIVAECVFGKIPVYVTQLGTAIAKEINLPGDGDNIDLPTFPPQLKYRQLMQ